MRIWLNEAAFYYEIKYEQNGSNTIHQMSKQGTYAEMYHSDFNPERIAVHLTNMIIRILKDERLNKQHTKITSFSELQFCEQLQPYADNIQSWFSGSTLVTETPNLLEGL